ncbi:hypothetical protein GGR54DRAFT_602274 [Hypoxylon sp. NC1633]|nr:hypothetical protein GGR54DRAFT_602274 [Hypoxylon sp. NC1633]
MAMSKKSTFTTISPLPAGITREVVIDFLHSHSEMIDLNPLVIERHPMPPPAHAPPEEQRCVWWSMTDKISYLPGGVVSGDITYSAAFNDLPNGVQTHCYAPMGTDIRERWTLNGSLPGEPPEPRELGINAPRQGLYLREDVELRCNFVMSSFVKKTLKKAHSTLVDQLLQKAQITSAATTPAPSQRGSHQYTGSSSHSGSVHSSHSGSYSHSHSPYQSPHGATYASPYQPQGQVLSQPQSQSRPGSGAYAHAHGTPPPPQQQAGRNSFGTPPPNAGLNGYPGPLRVNRNRSPGGQSPYQQGQSGFAPPPPQLHEQGQGQGQGLGLQQYQQHQQQQQQQQQQMPPRGGDWPNEKYVFDPHAPRAGSGAFTAELE